MAILKGVDAERFPELKALLENWVEWVADYCRHEKRDAPWWYNEQTSTSTLVNVIAKMDGWALMELPQDDKPSSTKKADLWFMFRDDPDTEFLAEAKRPKKWCFPHVKDWLGEAGKNLRSACKQVQGYSFREDFVRFGMFFLVPAVKEGIDVAKYVNSLVSQFEGWDACDARAWFFYDSPPAYLKEGKGSRARTHPGVMLLVRKV